MTKSGFFKTAAYAGVSAAALLMPCAAFAQDGGAPVANGSDVPAGGLSADSSGEIIVTAERRSGTASRIPMSITAIGSEDLSKLRVQSANDVVKLVPGLSLTPSNYGTPVFNIRGLSFETYNLSSTSPVGVYVDQVAYAYPLMAAGGVFDVARVEVLKGPQGTLYGRNTTGGLINFISNQPTDTPQASITLEAGNYQTLNTRGFASGPLSSTLKARFAWQVNTSGKGWQQSITRPSDRLGKVEKESLRGILAWEPSSDFKATISANYWHDGSDTQAPQAAYFTPLYSPFGLSPATAGQFLLTNGAQNKQADWTPRSYQPASNTSSPRAPYVRDEEFYSLAANLEYRLSDSLTLYSLTGYNHMKRNDSLNDDGTAFEVTSGVLRGKIKSVSEELRLAGEGSGYNWMIGGYYSSDIIDESTLSYLNDYSSVQLLRFFATTLADPRYTATQIAEGFRVNNQIGHFNNRSASVFANGQISLSSTIKATGGIRYTKDRSRFSGCAADYEGNTVPIWNTAVAFRAGLYPGYNAQPGECMTFNASRSGPSGLVRKTLSEDNISWRGAIDWSPAPSTLVYAAIGQGYKSGTFPVIPASSELQFVPAKQEKVTSFELGVKSRVGAARFTLAGYYNDYRNKQVFGKIADPIFVTLDRVVNIPKSETYGAEATVDWSIVSGLTARGSAAYVRTKVKQYVGYDPFGILQDFRGTEFPNTPRWQLSGNLTYGTEVSETKRVEMVVDASYQSRSHSDFFDQTSYATFPPFGSNVPTVVNARLFNVPAYTLVNSSISLADTRAGWRAAFWVRNVFDKDYTRSASFIGDFVLRYAGMPRTYGVSLTFDFGK